MRIRIARTFSTAQRTLHLLRLLATPVDLQSLEGVVDLTELETLLLAVWGRSVGQGSSSRAVCNRVALGGNVLVAT